MVRILTDSTADLTHEDAAELGVIVVPLTLNFGEKHYLDGIDLTPEEFFEQLESAEKLPTTSQPTPEAFLKEFECAVLNPDTLFVDAGDFPSDDSLGEKSKSNILSRFHLTEGGFLLQAIDDLSAIRLRRSFLLRCRRRFFLFCEERRTDKHRSRKKRGNQ